MSAMKEIIVSQCVMCGGGIPKPKRGPVGKTCSSACRKKLHRLRTAESTGLLAPNNDGTGFTLPNHQITCDTPVVQAYTASSIVILSDSERLSDPTFDWELAQQLARDFCRPVEWVERGIRACREAGTDPQYFINRYLHHQSQTERMLIPMNQDVDQAYREILKGVYQRGLTTTISTTV